MAKKISELDVANTLTGLESVELVQVGVNVKTTLNDVRTDLNLVTLDGSQTLTNKSMVTPDLGIPSAINLTNATDVSDKRLMTDAERTKLSAIEALADVTDAGNVGSSIHGATAKTSLVDADELAMIDSAASNVLKRITWANFKNTLFGLTAAIPTAMLQNNAVTDAKAAQLPTKTLKGNSSGSTANGENVAISGALRFDTGVLSSKNSFTFSYIFSTATTTTDPGTNKCNFNSGQTVLYINPNTIGGRNLDSFFNLIKRGQLRIMDNSVANTPYCLFNVTDIANDLGVHWSITGALVAGVGSLPANNAEVIISYEEIATAQDVLDILADRNVASFNALYQLVDQSDVVRSGPPSVNTYADLLAYDPADYEDFVIIVKDHGLHGVPYRSDGTGWFPDAGWFLQATETDFMPGDVIWPAATWDGPYTLSSAAAGAETLITCPGGDVHGLTAAVAENKYLYVSAGTGTGVVGLHKITDIATDTTGLTIQIDLPYNGSNTITTVSKWGGVDIPLLTLSVPPLRAGSIVELIATIISDSAGVTSSRFTKIVWGGTQFHSINQSSTTSRSLPMIVRMVYKANSDERTIVSPGCTGVDPGGTTDRVTATFDAHTAATTLQISCSASGGTTPANIPYRMTHYELIIKG